MISFDGFLGGVGLGLAVGVGGVSAVDSGDLLKSDSGSFGGFLGGTGLGPFFVGGETLPSLSPSSGALAVVLLLVLGFKGIVGWCPLLTGLGEEDGVEPPESAFLSSAGELGGLSCRVKAGMWVRGGGRREMSIF